jgi:hypothetical protein
MTEFKLENMTAKEAAEALKQRKIIILPMGAIHKHGDGPLGTDLFSCTELSRRVGEAIPGKVIVVPTIPYGTSNGAILPGGINTSLETSRNMVKEVAMSFVKYGIKHFLFLTGHGGNDAAYLSVARELNKMGVLCAYVRWWDLIIQLKGDENPNYRNVNILEQSVDAACGKNDPSVLRDGETRLGAFGQAVRKDVLQGKFGTPNKMDGVLICAGSDPKTTSIPFAATYKDAVIQIPLPSPIIDVDNPEPGDWPSLEGKVSAEQGNDILNTCRDWIVEMLLDFEKLEIPKKYYKK